MIGGNILKKAKEGMDDIADKIKNQIKNLRSDFKASLGSTYTPNIWGWLPVPGAGGVPEKTGPLSPMAAMNLSRHPWIYAAVNAIIVEVLSAGFIIEAKNEEDRAFLEEFFKEPDRENSYAFIMSNAWYSFLVTGNCFFEILREEKTDYPIGLRYIPPNVVTYDPINERYIISGDKRQYNLSKEDVIHIKLPNPLNPEMGASPLDNIAGDLDLEKWALDYNKKFFYYGFTPTFVLKFSKELRERKNIDILYKELEKAQKKIAEQLMDKNQSIINVGPFEYEAVDFKNRDFEFIELLKLVRDRILAIYSVPPSKVGVFETANLGGGRDERQDFNFKKKLRGMMRYFEDAFNTFIEKEMKIKDAQFKFGRFDVEESYAKAQTYDLLYRDGVMTIDEIREKLGLPPLQRKEEQEEAKSKIYKRLADEGMIIEYP